MGRHVFFSSRFATLALLDVGPTALGAGLESSSVGVSDGELAVIGSKADIDGIESSGGLFVGTSI